MASSRKKAKKKAAKAKTAKRKPSRIKKGKPRALVVPAARTTCAQCVRDAVDEWCGRHVINSQTTLRDAFAGNGACNNGALRRLANILRDRCGVETDPDDLSCAMTVADLILLKCGF